jgi:leucyl/phenylalanyl-tRNA--protein transferase
LPTWLTGDQDFPPLDQAMRRPNGLLAAGGDLSPGRLLAAYRRGIFPWYSPGEPILWWSPDPRTVLLPGELRISRSLHKTLRKRPFQVTADAAFAVVIERCSEPRAGQAGTWITDEMKQAYIALHALGLAHSVESWRDGELVGGLYGVALGRMFYGESMFSRASDASKVAFVTLVEQLARWEIGLIDCQVHTEHLERFGAEEWPRERFLARLAEVLEAPTRGGPWRHEQAPSA